MSKTVVEFDAVGFRNDLQAHKKLAEQEVQKLESSKPAAGDKIAYLNKKLEVTSWYSMIGTFDIMLELMDKYTTYTEIEDKEENQDNDETGKITT
jgi:hypothetical protein